MPNGEIKPNPDPTTATKESLGESAKAERDYVDGQVAVLTERLAGIDKATKLLSETRNAAPEDVELAVKHLRELVEEMFRSVDKQFAGRDEAVKAAFSAQEKQAVAQDAGNQKAIDKSEKTTLETIKNNQDLARSTTDALTKTLDEVKLAVAGIVAGRQGGREQAADTRISTTDTRSSTAATWQVAGVIIAALAVIAVVLIAVLSPTGG